MMILVSSCLIGCNCRYDNNNTLVPELKHAYEQGFLFPVCPELMAGMGVPRTPISICGSSGYDVLSGSAQVISHSNDIVTEALVRAAHYCVKLSDMFSIRHAILKSKSPSCGAFSTTTYDGVTGQPGVVAAALIRHGVQIFDEHSDFHKVLNDR
ncbi:MAG: DUF523 domain-containing protein [Candidatus Auribacter fodinae]|jgi:uncharacterized protein YbbK (DUF523 family)|uniref:DUF523 domain-containing protein n=1 Tax=Candidatus Auribacter fodinae TaxID=2093366 RepID=A0A3A4R5M5_9BACT|nr:MAG: DUF523 domain-containing protein [Candidatus Auribacter fodinae]